MYTRPADGVERSFGTPWGEGFVTVRQGRLIGVDLPVGAGPAYPERQGGTVARAPKEGAPSDEAASPGDHAAAERWVEELEAYFRGERLSWSAAEVGLDDLAVGGFAKAVYATLLRVPPAVTVSYGALASMAGHPRAARAVGTAMATNPIPIVIPCHRVIRSDGSLGNYGDDPDLKGRLLEHERKHTGPGGGRP
jgi:O-6-methylguanine DNA methyltransferase